MLGGGRGGVRGELIEGCVCWRGIERVRGGVRGGGGRGCKGNRGC